MKIRQAQLEDLKAIIITTKLAFKNEVQSDQTEHKIVDELMHSESYIPELTLVAEIDNAIVGHIMYSKIKIGQHDGYAMAPLSVHPDYQKQGIGNALMEHTLRKIPKNIPVIILGHPSYYVKFGFVPASRYHITPPFDVPDDVFMVRESKYLTENGIQGVVEYPEALS
ncbi:GNAT family N-acetyltransferase [Macrococcoides caseolyticum]|uniref:GNAT family N-acetyltransferase n=1 Tax=Macrococcoides caseolyticum TaxID=69966 RepID=UPI001F31584D|nr:N-acetyltransferase [Macrococcus caseolyticus]MCE4955977.1 N-acetyltransferase [Macrococcus caseolyticus]